MAVTQAKGPVQVRGEVLSVKQVGDYLAMTVVASGIAEQTRPGQFVAVAVSVRLRSQHVQRVAKLRLGDVFLVFFGQTCQGLIPGVGCRLISLA